MDMTSVSNLTAYLERHTDMTSEEANSMAYDIVCCVEEGDYNQAGFLIESLKAFHGLDIDNLPDSN